MSDNNIISAIELVDLFSEFNSPADLSRRIFEYYKQLFPNIGCQIIKFGDEIDEYLNAFDYQIQSSKESEDKDIYFSLEKVILKAIAKRPADRFPSLYQPPG